MDGKAADDFVGVISNEEVVAAGTFDFFDGKCEGVGSLEIMHSGVEVFAGAVGFFDCQGVEGFGMNDADDLVGGVYNGEMGKAGFVKLIEGKRAEDLVAVNVKDFGFRYHKVADFTVFKTHNSGYPVAIFAAEDRLGSALHDTYEILKCGWGVFGRLGFRLGWTEPIELWINPFDDFS